MSAATLALWAQSKPALGSMAYVGRSLHSALRRRRPPSPRGRRPASERAPRPAGLAGFGDEMASPHGAAARYRLSGSPDDQDSRRSIAVSSVRSLTDPLFEDCGGVILVELDQLQKLAFGPVIAPGDQRLHEF